LLLKDGGILEQGSHDALMRQDGAYAELFKIQAERYGVNDWGSEGQKIRRLESRKIRRVS